MKNCIRISAAAAAMAMATPALAANQCEAVAGKYRALLGSSKPDMPQYVVLNLSRDATSGIRINQPLVENVDAEKLQAWAKQQTLAVTFPEDVLASIAENTDARQDLEQLPDTNFYSVNGTAGTLSCYQPGTYFQIANGEMKSAEGPANWTEEGSGCQVIRSFGSIDATPVVFEEGTPESGEVLVTVTPWNGAGFDAPCTATFKFDAKDQLTDVTIK